MRTGHPYNRQEYHDIDEHEHVIHVHFYDRGTSTNDDVNVYDWRSATPNHLARIIDLDDPANDITIGAVVRAIHDRCPNQYHANIINAALYDIGYIPCAWCPDDDVTGRERPPSDGAEG